MREKGSTDTPEIEASDKDLPLNVGQSQIALNEASGIGAHTNIITEITGIEGSAEGKEDGRFRDPYPCGIVVSVVLALVTFVAFAVCHRFSLLLLRDPKPSGIDLLRFGSDCLSDMVGTK